MEWKTIDAGNYPGIGGTDISVILGLNKYRTALDFWEEQRGLKEKFEGNLSTEIGLALEEFNIKKYEQKTGVIVREKAAELGDDWYRRSPDGLIYDYYQPDIDKAPGELIVYEGKTSFSFGAKRMFGEEDDGASAIPEYYQLQVQWYMAKPYSFSVSVCDVSKEAPIKTKIATVLPSQAHISALLTTPDHRVYAIQRDPEVCERITQFAEHWWKTHIIGDVPPDESKTDVGRGVSERISNGNLAQMDESSEVQEYRRAKSDYDAAKKNLEKRKEAVIQVIGENEGVRGAWGKITYKPYISQRLNRKQLLSRLTDHVGKDVAEDIIAQSCTKIQSERFKADFYNKEKSNG